MCQQLGSSSKHCANILHRNTTNLNSNKHTNVSNKGAGKKDGVVDSKFDKGANKKVCVGYS